MTAASTLLPATADPRSGFGDSTSGRIEIEPLDWDSRVLGRRAARLTGLCAAGDYAQARRDKERLLGRAIEEAQRRRIEYLTVRVASDDLSSLHSLGACGFVTLDTILTFARQPNAAAENPGGVAVRSSRAGDIPALRRIAETSFRFDRYHSDPVIPPAVADRLHGEWIENSIRGFADAVLVAEDGAGQPIGFATIRRGSRPGGSGGPSCAVIVLVATAAAARGRGVGRALTGACLQWGAASGVERMEVGTQLRNLPACRLYLAAGFTLADSSVSLRWVPSGPNLRGPHR